MNVKGLKIFDNDDGFVYVKLQDIFEEIPNGNQLYWSILFLDAVGNLGEGKSIVKLGDQVRESEVGYRLSWKELNELASKFDQVIDIQIIGCADKQHLVRYSDDQDKYENCNVYIEMVDTSFWLVFSKDESLIDRLSAKFKEVECLESNF